MAQPSKATWKRYLPVGLLAVLLAVGTVIVLRFSTTEAMVPIESVTRLDDRTLLVAGTSGTSADVRRWSSISTMGSDGIRRGRVHERGALRVIGVDRDRVWLDHSERKIHARGLPGLDLDLELASAIAEHPALSHGYQVEGLGDAGLVLASVNGKRFVVDDAGTIAPVDTPSLWSVDGSARPMRAQKGGPTYADARKVIAALPLAQAVAVGDTLAPATFDDPPGFLVRSFELVVGGTAQSLHRVGIDGTIVWSNTAAQMLDATALGHQTISLAWAGWLGGELTAMVQVSEVHSSDGDTYAEHSQWLLTLDPRTGAATSKREVTVPK